MALQLKSKLYVFRQFNRSTLVVGVVIVVVLVDAARTVFVKTVRRVSRKVEKAALGTFRQRI